MKKESNESHVERSFLMNLFESSLKDLYWAERSMTGIFPKMIKEATSSELKDALKNHLEETRGHVEKIEKIFELIDRKVEAKKCAAMEGLIKECEEMMTEMEVGSQRDAAIILSSQKMEHYEIASYGTMATYAKTMGLIQVTDLLKTILSEEKNIDQLLTTIAVSSVNKKALETEEIEAEE